MSGASPWGSQSWLRPAFLPAYAPDHFESDWIHAKSNPSPGNMVRALETRQLLE